MLVYGECECFVMQMLYVCVLCASCGSSQCCVLHDLQFVNAGRGCNRRPYRRGILQSRSHNCFIGSHECLLLFTPSCCGECFLDTESSSSSCQQTIISHSSVHCFPTSLNIIRSSKEQGCESWEHCNMCAMVSSAFPQAHVVSPV